MQWYAAVASTSVQMTVEDEMETNALTLRSDRQRMSSSFGLRQTLVKWVCSLGLSIKYVTQFWPILTPSLYHTLSHIPGPFRKYVTHLGRSDPTPIFSRPSTINPDKSPLYKFSLNCSRGVLSGKVLSGVVFVRSPFCQNTSVTTES